MTSDPSGSSSSSLLSRPHDVVVERFAVDLDGLRGHGLRQQVEMPAQTRQGGSESQRNHDFLKGKKMPAFS